MKLIIKKLISLIIIIFILFNFSIQIFADIGGGSGVLLPIGDGATPKEHQALSMAVDSVASDSSLQAFCAGWNFTFSNAKGSISQFVPLSQIDFDGGYREYILPLTDGWTKSSTGISGGQSIRDLITDKAKYDNIIKAGCTVTANARVQKYNYSPNPAPKGTFTPLSTVANTSTELDSRFSEFSTLFLTNTKNDYYDLLLTLAAEPVPPPTPSVTLTLPADDSTVLKGTTVTFKGTGVGTHYIGGFVDGTYIGEQQNPNSDITVQMTYETTVVLDQIKDYTFQIKGRNTALASEEGSQLAESAIHTVHVIEPPPDSGNIYVIYKDYDTYQEIPDSGQTIPGVKFNQAKTVTKSSLTNYDFQGSYQTYSTIVPDKSKFTAAEQQIVTLTSSNQNAYVYFLYKKKPAPPVFDCDLSATLYDATVRVGEYLNMYGSAYDTAGHEITNYVWYPSGQTESVPNGSNIRLLYMTPGVYDLRLNVLCSSLNGALATAKITVTEPTPQAYINVTGIKKENRKMTIDGSGSNSPDLYPLDWTKTTWKVEPITSTGAKWELGVKLQDGTILQINQSTNQTSILKGQKKFDFQARYAGQYKVTTTVINSLNCSNSTTSIVTIIPDVVPVAVFNGDTYVERNFQNPQGNEYSNYAKIFMADSSYSPDGDMIKERIWGYRYNSNNNKDSSGNHIFTDEVTKYKYIGSPADTFYKYEGQRLVVENANDRNIELWTYDVGVYAFELTVIEDIPDSDTIKELLVDSDYKRGHAKEW